MIEFRPLEAQDLGRLFEWLNRPHVAEWWGGDTSLAPVPAKYLPRIASGSVRPHIAWLDTIGQVWRPSLP